MPSSLLSFSLSTPYPTFSCLLRPPLFSLSFSSWPVDSFYCLLPAGIPSKENSCCGQALCGRTCCRGEPNAAESHKHLSKPVICLLLLMLEDDVFAFMHLITFRNSTATPIWQKLFHSLLPLKIDIQQNVNINHNIYKIFTHESKKQMSTSSLSGLWLGVCSFSVKDLNWCLAQSLLTESNHNILQTLLREGVRRSTNLLIGLVFCHYATAKHACAKKHTSTLVEENC